MAATGMMSANQADGTERRRPEIRVTYHGWFGFEGFGLPIEGWVCDPCCGWRSIGRFLTHRRAARAAYRELRGG